MSEQAEAGVKSALRVFEILEVFHNEQRPLRLKDLTARLGLPSSSTAGLLKTMAGQGYLAWDASTRSYFPTARLGHLTAWIPGVAFESGVVAQALRSLQRATGELVVLGAAEDIHVEYVEALRSTHGIQLWTPPGTRLPMVNLGLGWLFLARMPDEEVARIWRRTIDTGVLCAGDVSLEALRAKLASLRERTVLSTNAASYADGLHPGHPGGGMVWGVIERPPGHRMLGIGIGGPAERLAANLDAYSAALRQELAAVAFHLQPGA
jgi:IclR family transcriptional regulator, acetate operon repressor